MAARNHLYSPEAGTFTFLVEEWDIRDRVIAIHAGAISITPARAAYAAVVENYKSRPERRFTLRHGARVILSTDDR